MQTSTDRFDPKVNRGTLPKDWSRCSGCGSVRPEHALKTEEGEVRCADEQWCKAQNAPRIGIDFAKPGAERTVVAVRRIDGTWSTREGFTGDPGGVAVCSTCGQALPHAVACGATIDPELLGGE